MSSDRNQQLDRLLEKWANSRTASAEELESLHRRIGERLTDDEEATVELPSRLSTPIKRSRLIAASLAALLLIAVGVWGWHHQASENDILENPKQPFMALDGPEHQETLGVAWTEKYAQHQSRLLAEYQEVFDENVAWVAETNKHCDFGLLPAASNTQATQNDYVAIRMTLWSRAPQKRWKQAQVFNLVVSREEMVEFSSTNGEKSHLAIWAYPIDKEVISIDLRYLPSGLAGVQIEGSNLLRRRQSQEIHSFEQDGVEYRLYQIADVLNKDDLG